MTQRANDLPKFDGQVVQMSTWLRALRQTEHHLPDEVAFFVRTGAKVNGNGAPYRSPPSSTPSLSITISSNNAGSVSPRPRLWRIASRPSTTTSEPGTPASQAGSSSQRPPTRCRMCAHR